MSWTKVSNNLKTSNIKVLVVDDEPLLRDFMSRFLAKEGFQVDTAEDGLDACKKINANKYQLIVSDIRMPKMDGKELLDFVAKNHSDVPIIMMTGFSDLSLADALSKGAKCVLTKPFKGDQLSEALSIALFSQKDRWTINKEMIGDEIELKFDSLEQAEQDYQLKFGNGGFKIKVKQQLYADSNYIFKLSFADRALNLRIAGAVKWEKIDESNIIEYGVEIKSADKKALDFLLENLHIQKEIPYIPAA